MNAKLLAAVKAFLLKHDEVVKSESYKGLYSLSLAHGIPYTGPDYEQELVDLREAVVRAEHPKPVFDEKKACLADQNEQALLADGYEDALIGICYRFGQSPLAAYDYDRCLQILNERDGMEPLDAEEYFEFNTLGAGMGKNAPVFVRRFD